MTRCPGSLLRALVLVLVLVLVRVLVLVLVLVLVPVPVPVLVLVLVLGFTPDTAALTPQEEFEAVSKGALQYNGLVLSGGTE